MKTASILVDRGVLIQALQSSSSHRFLMSADHTKDGKLFRETLDVDGMGIGGGRVKLTITTGEEIVSAKVEPANT